MDETETAFGPLHLRAIGAESAGPVDRISVRDYVREAEIGAFAAERGVTQRIRFNVVLEVAHHAAAREDDVDQVVSYDMIVKAIERLLSEERVDLLETLAERLAQACLEDRRVSRSFIRVEKLDRIPGALGVEIVRSRVGPDLPRLLPEAPVKTQTKEPVDVIYLDGAALKLAGAWLSAIAVRGRPAIVCVGPGVEIVAPDTPNARRRGYLMVEMTALELADMDERFEVVSSRTEMEWSLDAGVFPIWAPARMAEAGRTRDVPDAASPAELAGWLSEVIEGRLVVVGDTQELDVEATFVGWSDPDAISAI